MSFSEMRRRLNAAARLAHVDYDWPWPPDEAGTTWTAIGKDFEPLRDVMLPEAREIYQHHLDRAEDAFHAAVRAELERLLVAMAGRRAFGARLAALREHVSDLRWFASVGIHALAELVRPGDDE